MLFPGNNDLDVIKEILSNLGRPDNSVVQQIAAEKQEIIERYSKKAKEWTKILPKSTFPADEKDDSNSDGRRSGQQ